MQGRSYSLISTLVGLYLIVLSQLVSVECRGIKNVVSRDSSPLLNRDIRDIDSCGMTYTDETGSFTSPNFPNKYPADSECLYTIDISGTSYSKIQLWFDYLYLESSDYVNIHDGASTSAERIKYANGDEIIDVVTSSGNILTIDFDADGQDEFPGFYANWKAIDVNSLDQCGVTYTDISGIFTSPNYPDDYDANENCAYYITSTTGPIQLRFNSFYTEINADTDFVTVYDGDSTSSTEIATYYGNSGLPPLITSSGFSLTVVFTSDHSANYEGFYAAYGLGSPLITYVCSDYGTDQASAIVRMGGLLYSHNSYPEDYPALGPCVVHIRGWGLYSKVYVKFIEVDLYGCSTNDEVTVEDEDGELLGAICDSSHNGLSFTSSNLITITFNAVEDRSGGDTLKGFVAAYSIFYEASTSCSHETDFKCDNDNCIDSSLRNDDYDHCGDNSDESSSSDGDSSVNPTIYVVIGIVGGILFLVVVIGAVCYWVQKGKSSSATAPARTDTGGTTAYPTARADVSAKPAEAVGGYYHTPDVQTQGYGEPAAGGGAPGGGYYNPDSGYQPQYNPDMEYNPSEPAKGEDLKASLGNEET